MFVTTPFLMCPINGSWMLAIELGAIVGFEAHFGDFIRYHVDDEVALTEMMERNRHTVFSSLFFRLLREDSQAIFCRAVSPDGSYGWILGNL